MQNGKTEVGRGFIRSDRKPEGVQMVRRTVKFSKNRIESIFAQEKSRQMYKRHPQGSSRSRTLGTASGEIHGILKHLY